MDALATFAAREAPRGFTLLELRAEPACLAGWLAGLGWLPLLLLATQSVGTTEGPGFWQLLLGSPLVLAVWGVLGLGLGGAIATRWIQGRPPTSEAVARIRLHAPVDTVTERIPDMLRAVGATRLHRERFEGRSAPRLRAWLGYKVRVGVRLAAGGTELKITVSSRLDWGETRQVLAAALGHYQYAARVAGIPYYPRALAA